MGEDVRVPDRRQHERLFLGVPADFRISPDGPALQVTILDLSPAGAGLRVPEEIRPGTWAKIVYGSPSEASAEAQELLNGRVVHCESRPGEGEGFHVGVVFQDPLDARTHPQLWRTYLDRVFESKESPGPPRKGG